MEVLVNIKVKQGDECLVVNYRSPYKHWENGVVDRVSVGIDKDLKYRAVYTVRLHRKVTNKKHPWGKCLFLTVNDDNIEPIKE